MYDGHAHACGQLLTARGIETYLDTNNLEKIVLCGGELGSHRNYPYPMLADLLAEERVATFMNHMIKTATAVGGFAAHFCEENIRVYQLKKQLPGRILNAYWVNPLEPNYLETVVQFYHEYSFSMIKLHQCWTAFDVAASLCEPLFDWAARQHIPVFIHLSDRHQAVQLIRVANQFPESCIISAHMLWAREIYPELVHRNVWFDLSSPQMYHIDTLRAALQEYGADRLMLGSDTPYGRHNITRILKRLEQLLVSADDLSLITGQNLAQLLGE